MKIKTNDVLNYIFNVSTCSHFFIYQYFKINMKTRGFQEPVIAHVVLSRRV
jgi:hypothetical protein